MISKHISYKEGTRSISALRLGLGNEPNNEQFKKMALLADKVFEPLRQWVGGPIRVNSFFRCEALNTAIGGSKKSQHVLGQAIDIDDVYGFETNARMFDYIRKNLDFDQMIWEFGNNENPDWIHVSYVSKENNRNKCLRAYKNEEGKTIYKTI